MTSIEIRPKPEIPPKPGSRRTVPRRFLAVGRKRLMIGVFLVALIVVAISALSASRSAPKPVAPVAPPALTAHGAIEPVAHATIASMSGGVVRSLPAKVGQPVSGGQVIATIAGPVQTEVLVAPWDGTVIGLDVNLGDTVMPGAAVATVGDLSRYQVETTDVDEYLIGRIYPGQQVTMTVEALNGRQITGTVETVALVQQSSAAGVSNYPVVIKLLDNDSDLRPGMTVRIVFSNS